VLVGFFQTCNRDTVNCAGRYRDSTPITFNRRPQLFRRKRGKRATAVVIPYAQDREEQRGSVGNGDVIGYNFGIAGTDEMASDWSSICRCERRCGNTLVFSDQPRAR
jgi:hypothetical protein